MGYGMPHFCRLTIFTCYRLLSRFINNAHFNHCYAYKFNLAHSGKKRKYTYLCTILGLNVRFTSSLSNYNFYKRRFFRYLWSFHIRAITRRSMSHLRCWTSKPLRGFPAHLRGVLLQKHAFPPITYFTINLQCKAAWDDNFSYVKKNTPIYENTPHNTILYLFVVR